MLLVTAKPEIKIPENMRAKLIFRAKPFFIPRAPKTSPDTSIPDAQIVSAIPRVFSFVKERMKGSARI